MKTLLFLLVILFFSHQIFGQGIYSGIWDDNCYHFDFDPDTIIYQPENNETNTLEIDLNGDGTNDFEFSTYYRYGAQWYWESRIMIEGLNQNQIAFSHLDSCMSADLTPIFVYTTYAPQDLFYNELIDNNLNWTDSIVDQTIQQMQGFHVQELTNFRIVQVILLFA